MGRPEQAADRHNYNDKEHVMTEAMEPETGTEETAEAVDDEAAVGDGGE